MYSSGQYGTLAKNGTDALLGLEPVLHKAGSDLSKMVNCMFFLKDTNQVYNLFSGFFQVFNANNPPPPTRGEYTGPLQCDDCFVSAKCIAAIPKVPDAPRLI